MTMTRIVILLCVSLGVAQVADARQVIYAEFKYLKERRKAQQPRQHWHAAKQQAKVDSPKLTPHKQTTRRAH